MNVIFLMICEEGKLDNDFANKDIMKLNLNHEGPLFHIKKSQET